MDVPGYSRLGGKYRTEVEGEGVTRGRVVKDTTKSGYGSHEEVILGPSQKIRVM